MRYRFTGEHGPEDFPAPPIARRLEPGDVIETDVSVEHARLELLPDDPKPAAAKKASPEKEA